LVHEKNSYRKGSDGMPKSEVAQLMEQIERECQAMQRAMYGYAQVASHQSINGRYAAIGRC